MLHTASCPSEHVAFPSDLLAHKVKENFCSLPPYCTAIKLVYKIASSVYPIRLIGLC